MLGQTLGETRGDTIGRRIVEDEGQGTGMEVTDTASGTLLGVNVTQTVTYVGHMRPDGSLLGEGTGIVMTAEGEGGTLRGRGVGKFTAPGAVSWRGLLLYEMGSGKLAGLNGMAVLSSTRSTPPGSRWAPSTSGSTPRPLVRESGPALPAAAQRT
jgi:hypothetical protein